MSRPAGYVYLSANPATESCEQIENVYMVEYLPISEPRMRDVNFYTETDDKYKSARYLVVGRKPKKRYIRGPNPGFSEGGFGKTSSYIN